MKQLLLVRHATAAWNSAELEDFNRPLNQAGDAEAIKMAAQLVSRQITPELLVSSPALRAISTARYFADILNINRKKIQEETAIYEATVPDLLKIISRFDDNYTCVALFGHNPGVTNLLLKLTNEDIYDFPTCGMALIEFPFDSWNLVSGGTGELKFFEYPRI